MASCSSTSRIAPTQWGFIRLDKMKIDGFSCHVSFLPLEPTEPFPTWNSQFDNIPPCGLIWRLHASILPFECQRSWSHPANSVPGWHLHVGAFLPWIMDTNFCFQIYNKDVIRRIMQYKVKRTPHTKPSVPGTSCELCLFPLALCPCYLFHAIPIIRYTVILQHLPRHLTIACHSILRQHSYQL